MFPLTKRKLIRGFQAHIQAGLGGAADYVADQDILYLPFAGMVETYWGNEGGNWLRLIRDNGDKLEFAHLSKYIIKSGHHEAGEKAAITGNTGSITTGPHLHIQIINKSGNRLDPERYDWKDSMNQAKIVVSKNSPTVYICYAVPSQKHLEERASLEGISVPNPIPNSDAL